MNSVRFKVNKQGASINHQTHLRNGQARINSGNFQNFDDINLLPPEFQIDSESGDADEDSDSSLGEDFEDSSLDSSKTSSSESGISNPLQSDGNHDAAKNGSLDSSDEEESSEEQPDAVMRQNVNFNG